MTTRAAAITGLGVISPIGNDPLTFWKHLTAGHSGVGGITLFDASQFPVRIGAQVTGVDPTQLAARFPEARGERDRKVWLGLLAADQAIADAGLDIHAYRDASLHVGVGLEAFFLEDLTPAAAADDLGAALARSVLADRDSPGLQTPLDRLTTLIGDRHGILGGQLTNCSACAAGAQAIGEALRQIEDGLATVAVAGGADSMLNPLGLGGFSLLRVLSAENDRPATACRPFDATREGTVLGEGAAFVVLESIDHASARGAHIYAELHGYASSLDASSVSDPDPGGRGAMVSMERAIHDAGLSPDDIDCISAHGTGTPKNDAIETAAIKAVMGDRAWAVPVHAVKSMTGHMIAASGAVEAVAAALTLSHELVPPTINLHTPDPDCDLDYVPHAARPLAVRTVLSNSFAFGGQNATLVFARSES